MRESKHNGSKRVPAIVDNVSETGVSVKKVIAENLKLVVFVTAVGSYLAYKGFSKAKVAASKMSTVLAINNNLNIPFNEVAGHALFSDDLDV